MPTIRPLALALSLVTTMLAVLTFSVSPAVADPVTKQTIDGFGAGGTGSTATRSWLVGAGTLAHAAGTSTLTVARQHGSDPAATLTYSYSSPVNLAANGADSLVLRHPVVTTTGNPLNDGISWSVIVTDSAQKTSQAVGNARAGQLESVLPLVDVGGVGLSGTADLGRITTIAFSFFPISNTPGITTSMTLDALVTRGDGIAQNISFTSQAPVNPALGTTYTVAAIGGGSGNPVTFDTHGLCTVAGSNVTFMGAGPCVITASQAGNDQYGEATPQTQTVQIAKGAQNTRIILALPTPGKVGQSATLNVRGSASDVQVSYAVGSSVPANACSIDGGTVRYDHVGTCRIDYSGGGDDNHLDVAPGTLVATIGKGDQLTQFTTPLSAGRVGDTITLRARGSGTLIHANTGFTLDSALTTNNACVVTNAGNVTYLHAGICVVRASGPGNDDYNAGPPSSSVARVAPATQSVAFTSDVPDAPVYPGSTYHVTTTSGGGSGRPVVVGTTTPAVCAASNGQVHFLKAGLCTISADQAGDSDHEAATQALQQVTVVTIGATVTVLPDTLAPVFGQAVRPVATVTPALGHVDGSVQFSVDGTDLGAPVPVDAEGTATGPAIRSLGVGTHQLGAVFIPADPQIHTSGQRGTGSVVVASARSTTKVSLTRTTITASISAVTPGAGTPTGAVEFRVDGASVGTATVVDGAASLTHEVPAGSSRSVSALYSGSAEFTASSDSTARHDPAVTASLTSSIRPSKAGWYRTPVTVTFRCSTAGSPLVGVCPAPVTLKADGAAQSLTRTVEAQNGGVATVAVSGINIDRKKPKITFHGLPESVRGTTPGVRCKARDALSGVRSCRVRVKRNATSVTWRAIARDKAGNKRVATRTRSTAPRATGAATFTLSGVPTVQGVPQVQQGKSYTMVVVSKQRPRYVNAAVAPRRPSGLSTYFVRAGSVNGTPRWVLGVTFTGNMAARGHWNIGVRTGGRMHVVKVHVVR